MKTPRRAIGTLLLSVTAWFALAVPAGAAAPTASIGDVQTGPGHVKVLFVAHDLPPDVGLVSSKISVTIDGTTVPASVSTAAESHLSRSIVLAIDTSGSMVGSGIAGAKSAATTLVSAMPADVAVGLVAFSDQVTVVSPLTTDRQRILAAIGTLQAHGNTALYDGLMAGLDVLGSNGQRRIVLLSDGGDTSSKATLDRTVQRATSSHVAIDAVGFRTQETQQTTLGHLTSSTGGVLYTANDAAGVAAAFSSVARSFVTQVYVDATVPAALAGHAATLTVSADTDAGKLTSSTTVQLAPGGIAPQTSSGSATAASSPAPAAASSGKHRSTALLRDVGLASLFVALSILALIALETRGSSRRRQLADIVTGYAPAVAGPATLTAEQRQARSAQIALQMTDRLLQTRGWGERLALKLDRAGLAVRANEWLVLQLAATVSLTVVCVLLGANIAIAALLCVLFVELCLRLWLGHRIERRRAAFLSGLPDALQVLAGSLSTGYSLDQAVDALLDDVDEPLAGEFRRAASEARLGVPLDSALAQAANRVQLEEFEWAVMAIQVQRTVGGSLAEVLRNVASTIRQREKLRRQVRVLSAEGRISAVIMVALPLFMAGFFLLFKPSYLRPLYTSPGGVLALIAGSLLVLIGWVWMRKVARVDV